MGGDNSATDKLVMDGGWASGHTRVVIKSAGDGFNKTNQGIRVVETCNQGSIDVKTFSLDSPSDGYSGYSFMLPDSGKTQLYLELQTQFIVQHYTASVHTNGCFIAF